MPVKKRPKLDRTIFDDEFAQDRADRRAESHVDEKLVSEEMRRCFDILAWQMEQPIASVFLEPVDWKALDLPWYPTLIKHPMDYGTLKTRLLSGQVPTPAKFADLMRLVYKNALKFNQEGSHIYQITQKLSEEFEGNYELVRLEKPAHAAPVYMEVEPVPVIVNPYAELESNIASMEAKLSSLQEETASLKASNQTRAEEQAQNQQPHLRIERFDVAYPRKPFTFAQKEALCVRLAQGAERNAQMVDELLQVINVQQVGETLELDVESFDDDTLHKIQDFLDNYNDPSSSNSRYGYGDDEDYVEAIRKKKKGKM